MKSEAKRYLFLRVDKQDAQYVFHSPLQRDSNGGERKPSPISPSKLDPGSVRLIHCLFLISSKDDETHDVQKQQQRWSMKSEWR